MCSLTCPFRDKTILAVSVVGGFCGGDVPRICYDYGAEITDQLLSKQMSDSRLMVLETQTHIQMRA